MVWFGLWVRRTPLEIRIGAVVATISLDFRNHSACVRLFVCLSVRGDSSRQRAPNGNARACRVPHRTVRLNVHNNSPRHRFQRRGRRPKLVALPPAGQDATMFASLFPMTQKICSPPLKIDDTSLHTSVFRALGVTTNETSETNKGVRIVRHSACTPPDDVSLTFASMAM